VVADSHKCPCKKEEFKFIKRFTIFKTVNRFSKIKEAFTVKLKIISVNHYFRSHQTLKNAKKHFTPKQTEHNNEITYPIIIIIIISV
jgi:hypothetical protein